jgi:glutathione synthase/RimK-type ligase-like ATP-grasp enzyme
MHDNRVLYCIADYKNIFGSKFDAFPYRSGFDKDLLKRLFLKENIELSFIEPFDIYFINTDWKNKFILYTSSEEYKFHYKGFLEDIVLGLSEAGARVIPNYLFLRANNNKVFMEIVNQLKLPSNLHNLPALYFGTLDELKAYINGHEVTFPCVLKASAGSKSRGVMLAKNKKDLLEKAKKISSTFKIGVYLKELVRRKIHKGYLIESSFQRKFIIQPYIPALENDWKIIIYGEKYYILKRSVRLNDFRASGSGRNYLSGKEAGFPMDMLGYIRQYFLAFDVPNLSIDFGFDGSRGYIFEFQAVHYGTYTQQKSRDYYEYINGEWELKTNDLTAEEVYVYSIVRYMRMKGWLK